MNRRILGSCPGQTGSRGRRLRAVGSRDDDASCPGIKKGVGTLRGQREGAGPLLSWLGVPTGQGHLPAPGTQEGRDGQVQPVHLPPVLGQSCTT